MRPYLLASVVIAIISMTSLSLQAQEDRSPVYVPECVHPDMGITAKSADGAIALKLINRRQNYEPAEEYSYDNAICSPKSVNVHPGGKKVYVNSLEGGTTVVYSLPSLKQIKVIKHNFDSSHKSLWAPQSGLYKFTHYIDGDTLPFYGKPVESVFTHSGRFLWVPYYRRSFDLNAQDPSAVAIIDTTTDEIVRLMETGALPKMIAVSPDGKTVAIAHWGENTVGLIDVSSKDPRQWRHRNCAVVDYKLKLDYSLTEPVDRDTGSGYALRGTVFTPDNKYVLVGAMGSGGGIAVIDNATGEYLGRILGMLPNMRHLVISGDYLYLSINRSGHVQRCRLDEVYRAIGEMKGKVANINKWENAKVGSGARTIAITDDGRYVFAACNTSSKISVVDTRTMKQVLEIPADSYPVGLDLSGQNKYLFVTSQGRGGKGGNCMDVYKIMYY